MPRIARVVIADTPHHVTQRGNRREPVFFEDGDHARYLAFLKQGAIKSRTAIWAYCLMPNHVHIIVVPSHSNGLRDMFADAHRQYTNFINWRHGWTGHLWQGRFGSVVMDDAHTINALRYIAQNPVRAGLVTSAEDWQHSFARAILLGETDEILDKQTLLSRFPDLAGVLKEPIGQKELIAIRKSETSGRPLGSRSWLESIGQGRGQFTFERQK